jgi:hypothetical protein
MIPKWKSEFLEHMSIVLKTPDEKESEDNVDTAESGMINVHALRAACAISSYPYQAYAQC